MNITQHLLDRHCNLELHQPILSEEEQLATFLLWNLSGQLVGYQRYRPGATKTRHNDPREGRYFTRVKERIGVFGLELYHLTPEVLFITEGIFDACRLTKYNVSCVALLTSTPSTDHLNWFQCLSRRLVFICDNNDAGSRLSRLGYEFEVVPDVIDLGEASEDYVKFLVAKYTSKQF